MACQPCIADAVIVEPAVTAAAAANAISNLRTMTLLHICAGHRAGRPARGLRCPSALSADIDA
jgi:hypothetical protein